jgi:signal transduction histidine kinase/DNA-binding response OmpR family regulator
MGTNTDAVYILIVDDLPEKLLVFQSILEELQQNLVMVRSGRDALRQLLEHEFAVVLLDVNMPDIDGFETAAMIRNYKKTAQTPIIFITAYTDDIQTVRGYALGAVDYITTPVVPEILRSKVKVFVDLYRMNRQLRLWADERESLARAEAARAAAEEAQRRANFLSEVSNTLTRSLDSESILQRLLAVAVPSMADIAAVALLNDGASIASLDPLSNESPPSNAMVLHAVMATSSGVESKLNYEARSANIQISPPRRLLELINRALQTGEVSVDEEASWLQIYPQLKNDPAESEFTAISIAEKPVALRWLVTLPLYAGSSIAGALLLGYSNARNYQDGDLALAKEVSSRASIALENSFLYREIQNGDRRKSEFLAMLAHELRNPLAPIRNAVHIIEQLQLGDATLDWAAQIIGNQVTHIARIVDDLLDVARIARGKVELRSDIVTLGSIVQHSLETSRPHIDARSQRLFVDLPTEQLLVRGDVVRLAQVLSNLLNNASKYTPAGGHIWLRAQCINDEVVVSVRDNGAGIAAELLPDIFELFRQGAQSMDRAQGGLGVGLTLVKQLVELHDGSVQARSAGTGHGAEFIVRLPLCITAEAEPGEKIPATVTRDSAMATRVLIVDDQKSSADSLRRIFEMKSFSVEVAYDGPSALQVAALFKPDVVILDIGLPGMDGFEVAQTIKTLPLRSDLLLIALTGYGQSEDVQRALSVGFDVHLVKPVDISYLLSIISEHQFA